MVGRRDTHRRGQGGVHHGSTLRNIHRNINGVPAQRSPHVAVEAATRRCQSPSLGTMQHGHVVLHLHHTPQRHTLSLTGRGALKRQCSCWSSRPSLSVVSMRWYSGLQTNILVELVRHALFHRDPCVCLVLLTLSVFGSGLCSQTTNKISAVSSAMCASTAASHL